MPDMRALEPIDLQDILNGATILGSGGGGPYSLGQEIVDYLSKQTSRVMLADPDTDVGDDQTMAVSAAVGSPVAIGSKPFPMDIAAGAFKALEGLVAGSKMPGFSFVLPGEVGAGNSFIPMTAALQLGLPVVDASGAPRAMPTLSMATYAAQKDIRIAPIVIADSQTTLSFDAPDAATADGAMRGMISGAGFDEFAGIAFWAMSGAQLKKPRAAIHHTMSYALQLGQTLRLAKQNKQDPVEAVRQFLNGYTLITGTLVDPGETTQGGFDFGYTIIKADDNSSGNAGDVRTYNVNENLIAWNTRSSRPLVMGPDLMCYLTVDGQPFSNADLKTYQGQRVALIAAPCQQDYRLPAVIAAWEQALLTLGYGGNYVPVENLQQGR